MAEHDLSTLFQRKILAGGKPMMRPITFYIGLNKNGQAATKRLIKTHGGNVVQELKGKNSKDICLVDPHSKTIRDGRPAYSVEYIQKCIDAKRLLDIEDFHIVPVTTSRRTPPDANVLLSGRHFRAEKEVNCSKQASQEEIDDAKDSEVTDDMPCLPMFTSERPQRVLPSSSDLKTADPGKDQSKKEGKNRAPTTPSTGEVEKADGDDKRTSPVEGKHKELTVLKKRRLSEVSHEATDANVCADAQGHLAQPNKSPKHSANWRKSEDAEITRLCVTAKMSYMVSGRDPNDMFSASHWNLVEKAKQLPVSRTAEECLARATKLWKNGDTDVAESFERPEHSQNLEEQPRPSPSEKDNPGTGREDGLDSPDVRLDSPDVRSPQKSQEPSPAKHGSDQEVRLSDAGRRETREYIIELVSRVSKRGKVSKRKAFRALRAEHGHWRRALRLLNSARRKSSKNA